MLCQSSILTSKRGRSLTNRSSIASLNTGELVSKYNRSQKPIKLKPHLSEIKVGARWEVAQHPSTRYPVSPMEALSLPVLKLGKVGWAMALA